jgi:DNA-binding response OmpR family regulator
MPDANVEQLIGDGELTALPKILIADDDESTRDTLRAILEASGFQVVTASNVSESLKLINSESFDVLLSDLHMPNPGDGLTVVSAMRHTNPKAVNLILSAYPAMKEAAEAILLQADDVLMKPMAIVMLADLIKERLKHGAKPARVVESIATILEQEMQTTIKDWLLHVEFEPHLISVPLDAKRRSAHLPQLFRDLIYRLHYPQPLGTRALVSPAASEHGLERRRQGYTAAMMVEESRMLQVSIFQTLQNNLYRVNCSLLLMSIMAIADEVDSQLAQAMTSYLSVSKVDAMPIGA